jgi:hypothetical protein
MRDTLKESPDIIASVNKRGLSMIRLKTLERWSMPFSCDSVESSSWVERGYSTAVSAEDDGLFWDTAGLGFAAVCDKTEYGRNTSNGAA